MPSTRAHRRVAPLALAVLAACATTPPTPAPPSEPTPPAALVPPATASRPTIHERTLANGLRVYLLPDDSAPLVCVQVWVRAGSVDEHEARPGQDHGITGLSHFFEHLMFQGTRRHPDYDRALNPLGGRNNAFTYNDATAYWSYAPAEHLPFLLDLEADRFRHMVVDFVHLEPEREVVKNERRLRVDSDPAEIAEEMAIRHTFDTFSYRWGPIGWMSDLDAITLEEAQAYHRRHYRPDNAWVIISGNFELQSIDALLANTWGQIPTPTPQTPEPLPPLDTWTGVRADHLSREAPTTTLFLAWRAPGVSGADARDYAALELVDWALTAGKSGRVTQRLVLSDTPIATRVSASLMPLRHPYVWLWRVDLVPGRTTNEAIAAIDEAIADIARDGLTEGELARAIASLRADMVSSNLSHKDRAESVGFALASTGNPLFLFDRLEMLASITQDDIRRVARERLAPTTRVRMTVVPLARHRATITSLPTIEPAGAPFAEALGSAFDLFTAAIDLAAREAEAERETRAIRLLAERGERAVAKADATERQAIATWLDTNESGTTRRNARLAKQRTELAAERRALEAARAKLRQDVENIRRRLKANPAEGATLAAIRLLSEPLQDKPISEPLVATTPAARAILKAVLAFAQEARGHTAAAQRQREEALALLRELPTEAEGPVQAVVRDLVALLEDTLRTGVPLTEAPSVRRPMPTRSR